MDFLTSIIGFLFFCFIAIFIFLVDWRLNKIYKELKKLNTTTENSIKHLLGSASIQASVNSPPSDIAAVDSGKMTNPNDLIEKYGITMDADKYVYAGYKYERLEDAVAYAKKQQR